MQTEAGQAITTSAAMTEAQKTARGGSLGIGELYMVEINMLPRATIQYDFSDKSKAFDSSFKKGPPSIQEGARPNSAQFVSLVVYIGKIESASSRVTMYVNAVVDGSLSERTLLLASENLPLLPSKIQRVGNATVIQAQPTSSGYRPVSFSIIPYPRPPVTISSPIVNLLGLLNSVNINFFSIYNLPGFLKPSHFPSFLQLFNFLSIYRHHTVQGPIQ
ncbi:hypothetical protein PG994_013551 [Apiospora phragmitis]|uniref:Uncharacterized protein n=1 Tax=Apiospora phragmitis TaxID=2905665 RepID=A0ABR1TBJ4_9PEZI